MADNNAANFVQEVAPPGAEPLPVPNVQDLEKQLATEQDAAVREKIATAIRLAKEQVSNSSETKKRMSYEDFLNLRNPERTKMSKTTVQNERSQQSVKIEYPELIGVPVGEK